MDDENLPQRAGEIINRHEKARPGDAELGSLRMERLEGGGHNIRYRGQGSAVTCFIKFCYHDNQHILDICEREVFISLLGQMLEIPVVQAWSVPARLLAAQPPADDGNLIRDRFVLMPWIAGSTLEQSQLEAADRIRADPERVANLFAFLHWVGDEDRGLSDIMLSDGLLVLIDNGLCGPGRDPVLRGAHPSPNDYRDKPHAIIEKCNPGKPSLVAFVLRDVGVSAADLMRPTVIEEIEALTDSCIRELVRVAGLQQWVADVLILRQQSLHSSYLEWLTQAAQLCSSQSSQLTARPG